MEFKQPIRFTFSCFGQMMEPERNNQPSSLKKVKSAARHEGAAARDLLFELNREARGRAFNPARKRLFRP
jgi:hypothetical protein